MADGVSRWKRGKASPDSPSALTSAAPSVFMSTTGSCAVRLPREENCVLSPGRMLPPSSDPSGLDAVKVSAVPESITSVGGGESSSEPASAAARSQPSVL